MVCLELKAAFLLALDSEFRVGSRHRFTNSDVNLAEHVVAGIVVRPIRLNVDVVALKVTARVYLVPHLLVKAFSL